MRKQATRLVTPRKSLVHKLDYDARVLSQALLELHAVSLDSIAEQVVQQILPGVDTGPILTQLRLPGSLGGCFIMRYTDLALLAPLSACLQVRPLVLNWLRSHHIDTSNLPLCFDTSAAEASLCALVALDISPSQGPGIPP